jgi:hypothetical protein
MSDDRGENSKINQRLLEVRRARDRAVREEIKLKVNTTPRETDEAKRARLAGEKKHRQVTELFGSSAWLEAFVADESGGRIQRGERRDRPKKRK